jgi:hypothetical protein
MILYLQKFDSEIEIIFFYSGQNTSPWNWTGHGRTEWNPLKKKKIEVAHNEIKRLETHNGT